ncbi:unnamed protein product [Hyaloperonospora brassicae]|uniref:Cyclic nucleotide-binding domain-containing protein n=1 Tax=Hyaloperonospora brassicae TaxID=162125 RepID=A0AAV0TQD9_HYABA|nr:unnamed protein product [Hyaloperonospora brassicae]
MFDLEVVRRVGFFGALWTLQCCANVLGAISRDAIFLRSYAASSVAALTLALSLTTAYALTAATQLMATLIARRVRPGVLYAISPMVLASGLLALSALSLAAPSLARATSVLIYLWLEVAIQWLTQQFWDLCAKAFDVAESKKWFGVITFGSTFGTLLASFVVLPALQGRRLSTEFNLLVSAGMLFLVAGVLLVSAERFTAMNAARRGGGAEKKSCQAPSRESAPSLSSMAIVRDIQARTYVQYICLFDMVATVMRVLVDNTTLSVLSLQPEEEVQASLSMINGLQSFFMIPMQLASGSFFTRFGVMYGIAMLPVTILLFGASTSMSTSVYLLIFTRALYNAVSQAIFNPARQLLWLPLNEMERSRFQNFVCGPFRSVSRIVGAMLSMFLRAKLVTQYIGPSSSSTIMIATSAASFVAALVARRSYTSEFYASLRQGYLDLTSPFIDFTPDQIVLVKEMLVKGEQQQANFVLSSLSHVHIGLFSRELRALFYKKTDDDVSLTPMHTKLRILNIHTAAKREFVLNAQESYLLPDASAFPAEIFDTMDLMMLVKDKSVAAPRQVRVAAILACGYERFSLSVDQCFEMLRKLLHSGETDKSMVVCAAVALLRLSDWMDEESNVILQRLLHEERVPEVRVVGLKIIGREVPELLGDGFLVYLLHHLSTRIVEAAVQCCSNSSRNSRMLIPALMKHLSNPVICAQIVTALKGFEPAALWKPLCQYTEAMLQLPTYSVSNASASGQIHNKREGLAGALKVLDSANFPVEDKLDFLMHLFEAIMVAPDLPKEEASHADVLHNLFENDTVMDELVVDALLTLIGSMDEKAMSTSAQKMEPIHYALSLKIREAHKMRHVLDLFFQICQRTATNVEETSPLLLQHVEHSLKDTLRLLLKLLSTGFPKEFDVAVLLEGLRSDLGEVHSAIQEVLENLLPSSYKGLVLPLLFPKLSTTNAASKMTQSVVELFGEKGGVDILLDVMKQQEINLELSALALQYFLHVAADHAEHLDDGAKLTFLDYVVPSLLHHELTKELLVETYHSRPDVLAYESLAVLKDCKPPLLSRIAVANCLRASSLFENICATNILRVISHRFVPIAVERRDTFAVEGQVASAMYVVAKGTVQLHKQQRILAELGFGACIGQAALMRHSLYAGTHISSATAMEDCVLLSISRGDLDSLIRETPQVSRGVLKAVASSLRLLYLEPLGAIAQSGSLPLRDRRGSLTTAMTRWNTDADRRMLKMTESITSHMKAALYVDRATKSFLYNVGRSRTTPHTVPSSAPGDRARHRSFCDSQLKQRRSSYGTPALRGLLMLSDPAVYTTFEKSIHLKASHLMRDLDDDKVALVAQVSRVVVLRHGDLLYSSDAKVEFVYVIVDGTIEMTHLQGEWGADSELAVPASAKLHHGACFGAEAFVPNATARDSFSAVGRCTLFKIAAKDLADLSELHHDIMHVILAWLSQTLAELTNSMIAPLLSPTTILAASSLGLGKDDEKIFSELTNRKGKRRSGTD